MGYSDESGAGKSMAAKTAKDCCGHSAPRAKLLPVKRMMSNSPSHVHL